MWTHNIISLNISGFLWFLINKQYFRHQWVIPIPDLILLTYIENLLIMIYICYKKKMYLIHKIIIPFPAIIGKKWFCSQCKLVNYVHVLFTTTAGKNSITIQMYKSINMKNINKMCKVCTKSENIKRHYCTKVTTFILFNQTSCLPVYKIGRLIPVYNIHVDMFTCIQYTCRYVYLYTK